MSKRDPRIDPREGDVLPDKNGRYEVIVAMADNGWVSCHVVDRSSKLTDVHRMAMDKWQRCWRVNDDGNST